VSYALVPEGMFERVEKEISEQELPDLTYAVMAINGCKRMAILMRAVSVERQPAGKSVSATPEGYGTVQAGRKTGHSIGKRRGAL